MNSLILVVIAIVAYLIAYNTYGRFLARRIFKLDINASVPSHSKEDGIDYVPTPKHILFGHHFTTIAGLGPIVGPAIGIIWGWLPAFLWVIFGSILMGAVHDFSILIISARNQGKTLGDLTGVIINKHTRIAFQFIMQLLLIIVLAVFAMIISVLFKLYPESVLPVWLQIPIAIWLGRKLRAGKKELGYSIVSIILMYGSILLSVLLIPEVTLNWMSSIRVEFWCIILFIYVYIASTIPVDKLLQPRDYINSQQLLITLILITAALIFVHPVISAPAINNLAFESGSDVPDIMPTLFIVIACGAISGFHSIASSGTSVRQLNNEKDSLFIGFGSMLVEGLLAVIVLMAIAGGLGLGAGNLSGTEVYFQHYGSWMAANGLEAKLEAFIIGASNLIDKIGLSERFARPLIVVFIVSFANTTLDSAARIQRLSLQEIFSYTNSRSIQSFFANRYYATLVVILLGGGLTFLKPGGTGALILWPLFGALNQLLAAMALGVVTVYLKTHKLPTYFTLIPMLFVLFMTLWAMVKNGIQFFDNNEVVLLLISIVIFTLTFWLLIAGVRAVFWRKPNVLY